jgi:hypothetical protein
MYHLKKQQAIGKQKKQRTSLSNFIVIFPQDPLVETFFLSKLKTFVL